MAGLNKGSAGLYSGTPGLNKTTGLYGGSPGLIAAGGGGGGGATAGSPIGLLLALTKAS